VIPQHHTHHSLVSCQRACSYWLMAIGYWLTAKS
jgi:hypothetical protein